MAKYFFHLSSFLFMAVVFFSLFSSFASTQHLGGNMSCSEYDFDCNGLIEQNDSKVVSDLWKSNFKVNITSVVLAGKKCKFLGKYLGNLWKGGNRSIDINEVVRVGNKVNRCLLWNSCTDSDGGLNYTVSGTIVNATATKSDYCSSADDTLLEYSCVFGGSITPYRCVNGCSLGRCL